jgi:hypothetical protein
MGFTRNRQIVSEGGIFYLIMSKLSDFHTMTQLQQRLFLIFGLLSVESANGCSKIADWTTS